jgi:nitrite reductase/ring-hydroxylating ferredoxin subunit
MTQDSSTSQASSDQDDFEPLVQAGHAICSSDAVEDQGDGFRFMIRTSDIASKVGGIDHRVDETLPAFVIRHDGVAHAYLNRCAHVAMELDWQPGQFFTQDKSAIICASHDAQYLPDTGECISGPCPRGASLIKLDIEEKNGQIYLCQAV